MKVLITLSLASTILVVANLLISVTSTPVPISTPATNEDSKNINCKIKRDPKSAIQFKVAFSKCNNQTGFPGNLTTDNNVTYVEMVESNDLNDQCFAKCLLEELKLINTNGKLDMDLFASAFKTNAPEKLEQEKNKSWKNCAKKFDKQIKEDKKGKSASKLDRSCFRATEFFVCGSKSTKKLLEKCQKKHKV